ncbi:F0F1 ATP synthase subunit B [bacterium]|nr:F0F1 ATP synthase subunit B [bacterium]
MPEVLPLFLTNIVGFILLVLVLKKFAWGPVVDLLEKRRAEISAGYEKIEKLEAEMAAAKADYEARVAGIEATARERINEAAAEGRRLAAEIQENARREAENLRRQAERNIELQMESARAELKHHVIHMVMATTRKLLGEKVDAVADRALAEAYVDELSRMKQN